MYYKFFIGLNNQAPPADQQAIIECVAQISHGAIVSTMLVGQMHIDGKSTGGFTCDAYYSEPTTMIDELAALAAAFNIPCVVLSGGMQTEFDRDVDDKVRGLIDYLPPAA